jgi:acetyltransferase-like isoleucine patch superfamily enzyme
MISDDTKIGKGTRIWHPELVNIYGAIIGDDCNIGAFVEIRRNVYIGNRVRIQAFVFIPEGVVIEDDVFIGPHVCFTNDKYPASSTACSNEWNCLSTIVKRGCSIGANSTILPGVTIETRTVIGAGSVVTKNVPRNVVCVGNPARIVNCQNYL